MPKYYDVFASKGSKQRYMDLGAQDGHQERRLGSRESGNRVEAGIDQIVVFVDEHSYSTEGKYNLSQSIDEEFRLGM